MQISNYSNAYNICQRKNSYNYNTPALSFKAHSQVEKCAKKGISKLIHQTAVGRESQTNEFVCNYINDNLLEKDTIKIVSGGCSTGEEAVTWSMLLHNIRNKVEILGVDLGKKAIKQANSRKFVFEIPSKQTNILDHFESIDESPYTDIFLLSGKSKGLSAEQKRLLHLFNEFFEPTNREIKRPFLERLHNQLQRRMGIPPLELDRVEYKLKDGMAENCKFVQGDIRELDKILGDEKADIILFKNAMYHLTIKNVSEFERSPKENSESIVEGLINVFKKCLNKNGLVVFGEDEGVQMSDYTTVPKIMKKLGFTPLNKTATHDANVWKYEG